MKKHFVLFSILMISSAIILNSCKKKEDVDSETQTVVDNALCEQQFMSITPTINERASGSSGFKIATCGRGSWVLVGNDTTTSHFGNDTLADPNTGQYINGAVNFMIDYDQTAGCPDIDNQTKSGKIKIKSSHKWSAVNTSTVNTVATATITFLNYVVDGVTYEGMVTLTKTGNGAGSIIRTIVSNGHCSKNGYNIYYTCDKTLTKDVNGNFTISGVAKGINREGRNFSVTIINPLFKPSNYKYITSGTQEITPDGFKTRTVDFGTGTLDDKATFTVNGQTIEFKMQ